MRQKALLHLVKEGKGSSRRNSSQLVRKRFFSYFFPPLPLHTHTHTPQLMGVPGPMQIGAQAFELLGPDLRVWNLMAPGFFPPLSILSSFCLYFCLFMYHSPAWIRLQPCPKG